MKKRVLLSAIGLITILNVSSALPVKAKILENNNVPKNINLNMATWIGREGTIYGKGVKLRAAPGTSAKIITILGDKQKVTVLEREDKKVNGYQWYKIRTKSGQTGYVTDAYLGILV